MDITRAQLEVLSELVTYIEQCLEHLSALAPARVHLASMGDTLQHVSKTLRGLYLDIGGGEVWKEP